MSEMMSKNDEMMLNHIVYGMNIRTIKKLSPVLAFKIPTFLNRNLNTECKFSSYVMFDYDVKSCQICGEMVHSELIEFHAGVNVCNNCKKKCIEFCPVCVRSMVNVSNMNYSENIPDECSELNWLKNNSRHNYSHMVKYNGKIRYICTACYSSDFRMCDNCKTEFFRSEGLQFTDRNRPCEKWVCSDCINTVKVCKDCRTTLKTSEFIDNLCIDCFKSQNSDEKEILNYGFKPFNGEKTVFVSLCSGGMFPFYGIELEVDNGKRDKNLMRFLGKYKEFYLKNDATLTSKIGFEMVSYPLSLEYHKYFDWSLIFKELMNYGYKSHDANQMYSDGNIGLKNNCGYHIHINRTAFGESDRNQSKNIAGFLYLVQKFKAEMIKFSRRKSLDYCEFYRDYNLNGKITREYQKAAYYNRKKVPISSGSSHTYQEHRNMVVNFMNDHTIELRLLRGTLNHNTFIAGIELCDLFVKIAISHDEKTLKSLSWDDMKNQIYGDHIELRTYLKKIGL